MLHGGRDIQVVDADFAGWQALASSRAGMALKRYPTLNHLGLESEADAGLASYEIPGHVDAGLIEDIATWIAGRP